MIPARYPTRLLLLAAMVLPSGCMITHMATRNIYRGVTTLSNHASAVASMDKGNLKAAQQLLTGARFQHRYAEIAQQESWAHLRYRAARIVVSAHNNGQAVDLPALCLAYITLFESREGLPDDPERMLGYMHEAISLLQADPHLLDQSNPDSRSADLSETTLEYYALWQYLADGGVIDWTTAESKQQATLAGFGYEVWFQRFRQTLQGLGAEYLEPFASYGRDQFVHDAVEFSMFPVFVCVAQRKGWKLTPPAGYQFDNFRGGGPFDVAHCGQDQPALPPP